MLLLLFIYLLYLKKISFYTLFKMLLIFGEIILLVLEVYLVNAISPLSFK